MKITKVALAFVSAFAASASARHLKAKKDEEAKTDVQRDLAPASRELGGWRPSGYHQTCGCIADYTKELTAFQFEVIAGLPPILFLDADYQVGTGGTAGNDIVNAINMVAMEASNELISDYMCGCENYDVGNDPLGLGTAPLGPPLSTGALAYTYQECCCDAEIVKDVFKNQMQTIGEMPSGYWLSGATAARTVWITALKDADASVLDTLPTYTPDQVVPVIP